MSRARAGATTTGTGRGAFPADFVAVGGRAWRAIAQARPTARTTIAAAASPIRYRLRMTIRSEDSNAYARPLASLGKGGGSGDRRRLGGLRRTSVRRGP